MTEKHSPKRDNSRTIHLRRVHPERASSSSQPSLQSTDVNPRSENVGSDLGRLHLENTAHPTCHPGTVRSVVAEEEIGSIAYTKAAIARHFAAVSEHYKEHAAKVSESIVMRSIAAAKQISSAYLAGLSNPPRGWSEFMHLQTSGLQRELEARKEMLRQVAEIDTPHLPPLNMRLSLGAFNALGGLSDTGTISNQHIPVQIHAVPPLISRSPKSSTPGSLLEHTESTEHGEQLLSASSSFLLGSEAPEEVTAWLEHNLDDNGQQKLLEHLSQFAELEEIPSDARYGVSAMLTWWKLQQSRLSLDESLQFNRMVLSLLQGPLGISTTHGSHSQLSSGLIVPRQKNLVPSPDLESRVFTSKELADHLSYDEATIRRKAAEKWHEGAGPKPLKGHPDWYVVGRGNNDGGRRCGWKFQQRKRAEGS